MASSGAAAPTPPRPLRVAFVGNSYIYFNDLPRLFQALCESDRRSLALQQAQPQQHGDAGGARPACPATAAAAVVGSCLRGGVSLKTVLAKGGEMSEIFATPNAIRADGWSHDVGAATVAELLLHPSQPCWDAIVMNDYSQAPCRPDTLADGLALMREQVASLLRSVNVRRGTTGCSHGGDGASGGGDTGGGGRGRGACVGVLLAPPAYREPRKGSGDIGTWAEFTAKVAAGYEAYRLALVDALTRAPVGARGGGGAGGGGGGSNTSSGQDGTAADCDGRGSGRSGAASARSTVARTRVVNNGAGGGGPNSGGRRDDVGGGGGGGDDDDDGDASVVVANANGAFALVRGEDEALWRDLFYSGDGYHPSPLGSFLEACCVFCAVRRRAPRVDAQTQRAPFSLWGRARFMLPDGAVERMPTAKEMLYLAEVAARATLLPPPKPRAAAVASLVAD